VTEEERESSKDSLCVVAAEALFILLPFVVIGIVLWHKGDLARFPYMPEWAIAAAILVGLALVRFTTGLFQAGAEIRALAWERVMLVFSGVIIFALVPSLLVLALVLVSSAVSLYLALGQVALFVMGLALFLALGWSGQFFLGQGKANHAGPGFELINRARAAGD